MTQVSDPEHPPPSPQPKPGRLSSLLPWTLTTVLSEPMVFRHNTADKDLAGAICLDPRLENGACHFRAVLLTWHFDSFHIHWFPLRISPLRFLENIREFELQVMYPRRIYGALLERQPALTDRPNDGENITASPRMGFKK